MLEQIGHTLSQNKGIHPATDRSDREAIEVIFAELGILSEKGSSDLIEMILYVKEVKSYQMSDLYRYLNDLYKHSNINKSVSNKAIEQRVRRTLLSALNNLAHLGIEDFGNYKFDRYATTLFCFQEVKKAMDTIRNKSLKKPTINIKQFINGVIALIK